MRFLFGDPSESGGVVLILPCDGAAGFGPNTRREPCLSFNGVALRAYPPAHIRHPLKQRWSGAQNRPGLRRCDAALQDRPDDERLHRSQAARCAAVRQETHALNVPFMSLQETDDTAALWIPQTDLPAAIWPAARCCGERSIRGEVDRSHHADLPMPPGNRVHHIVRARLLLLAMPFRILRKLP